MSCIFGKPSWLCSWQADSVFGLDPNSISQNGELDKVQPTSCHFMQCKASRDPNFGNEQGRVPNISVCALKNFSVQMVFLPNEMTSGKPASNSASVPS